jgi:hypothetical protein
MQNTQSWPDESRVAAFERLESELGAFQHNWEPEMTPEESAAVVELLALISQRLITEVEKDAAFAEESST